MSKGIYLFWDNKYEQVIYAGRFTGKQRIKDHFQPSKKHLQKINAYVQNHPDRIESIIFCEFDNISDNDLNQLEKETIKLFKLNKYKYPDNFVFNFTDGGDGVSGYKHPEEIRKKMSENHADNSRENHPMWGKKRPPETRKKMSEAQSGKNNSCWKDYPRITKAGFKHGKKNYLIRYNGKVFAQSIYKDKLYVKWYDEYPDIELVDETS